MGAGVEPVGFAQADEILTPSTARRAPPRREVPVQGRARIPPLVLLQLSDLHFGPHSRFAGCDLQRLAAQCRQALDEARGDLGWRESVGLVVVTGDIAEAARPPEYASTATFFNALAQQLCPEQDMGDTLGEAGPLLGPAARGDSWRGPTSRSRLLNLFRRCSTGRSYVS